MIRKILFFILILSFVLSALPSPCQEDSSDTEIKVPPGMELKKAGDLNIVVPQGAEVRKTGSLLFIESTSQYISRQLLEMEERFAKIEAVQEELKKEIESLKEAIRQAEQKTLTTKGNSEKE